MNLSILLFLSIKILSNFLDFLRTESMLKSKKIFPSIDFIKADEFKDEFYGELDQNFDEIKHKFYADLSDGGDSMKDSRKKDKKVINSIYQNNDCFRKILDLHRRIGKSIIFR